jgi:hypothetical protein
MCGNIVALRGINPPATEDEMRSAVLQFVRKVAALNSSRQMAQPVVERAVADITECIATLLGNLPPRRITTPNPPARGRTSP